LYHSKEQIRNFIQTKNPIKINIPEIENMFRNLSSGFNNYEIELSTRPEKFIGEVEDWEIATKALEQSLKEKKIEYQINEGEGAFMVKN